MLNLFKFEKRIQKYIDAQLLVGVALAIVKEDAVIYARGFGMTSVEDGATPITPKTMFAIGSTSKTLCATLVMRLVEQGKLDLDRPVQAYLPNFTFSDPHKGSKVTLRHVLSHTTGLPSGGKNWGPRHPNALRDVVYDQIAYYRFFAEPGAVYHYSTVPIDLAGCTAEMVTGKYYEELMQELVFDPLDMTHSTYDRLVAMTYPLALPHVKIDGGVQVDHRYSDNPSGNPDGFGISCARDMANLASMFLNRGRFNGEQFLTPESIQTMHKPHGNQYWDGCSPLYTVIRAYSGLGFMIGQYHGIPTVGHTGGMQSFTTNFHLFPEQGLGLILLLNYLDYDTGGELHKRSELLFDLSHELLELGPRQANHRPALPSTLTAAEQARWPSYAGTYLGASDNSRGGLVEVYLAENNLMLETGGAKQILVPIGERQYYFQTDSGERESVAFLPDDRGQVRHMMISSDAYYRIAIDGRHAPNPDLWTAYEGIYEDPSQPEPRARHQIQIRLEDGKLLVRIQGREVELTPLNNALFLSEFGLLEFLVAEDGSASTLIVQGATPYHRVNGNR